MTVTYTAQVATSSFSCFLRLLARWRGSIYKLLWKDFIVFAFCYYLLNFTYRFLLNDQQKKIFEMIARYCEMNNALIPVAFVLGFYVSLVMTRWWNQLGHIPWPDHMAMFVTANVHGLDERGRLMRRTLLRYINLAYAITMSSISTAVKKRFPTFQHMVDAGLLTQSEKDVLGKIQTPHNKFFIPLGWTTSLVNRARKEGRIKDDFAVKTLIDEINTFRMHLATLFVYDMISVPLVYTQVVTIAVYMFILACLMGRQFLTNNPDNMDLYFPLFTFLEYLFYMGWLKVAECFVNPFGEDEDDFDVNSLIDRNLQVSYLIVDEIHEEHPELIRDQYWDNVEFEMPYTSEAEPYRMKQPWLGSAMDLSKSHKEYAKSKTNLEQIEERDELASLEGQFEGSSPSKFPVHGRHKSTTSFGSFKGSYQHKRQFSRMSERGPQSPTTPLIPASYVGSMPESALPSSPPTSSVVFSQKQPSWHMSAALPLTPLTPPAEYSTQFPIDGLENEDAAETDPLMKDLPSEVFELKAIYNRTNSQSSAAGNDSSKLTPANRASTSGKPLTPVDEAVQETDATPDKISPKLTLIIPATAADTQEPSSSVPSHQDPDPVQSGAAVNGTRQRFVAPPPQSPDIPPTPASATPIWVQGTHVSGITEPQDSKPSVKSELV